ncbi:MAG: molybdenum cofactor biosynthesis protein A [Methanomassiliicoccales archaeon PtaU1.Bin124]|nr:MAG: molybdenum cofactor biosynthesis protein A [Methanomassiliicoccales archaeon PtaU1.Bin124]
MAFHSITYNEKFRFATVHNYGCTFNCPVCSYKLRSGEHGRAGLSFPKPKRFLTVPEMKKALASVELDKVYFMGGEPTVATELPEMLSYVKNDLGAKAFLGHTNGSRLPIPDLDGANVGLKAWDEKIHLAYTGRPKGPIFANFEAAYRSGMDMKANMVFVPGLVDIDQLGSTAEWLANLDRNIPFHIMGYIPVPGQMYLRPTKDQMNQAVETVQSFLKNVHASHLSSDEALDLTKRDERFIVKVIA